MQSLIPIIISLVISVSWLLNRSILVAYGKDFLKEGIKWIGNRPILVPTFAVFFLPIFIAYLTLNQIPDILKFILPLITFIAGQFIGKYEKQIEIKDNQKESLSKLKRSLSRTREKISLTKKIVQLELDSINSQDRGIFEERLQSIDEITEDFLRLDSSKLIDDKLLTIDEVYNLREISLLIDRFNELIEERREYISKCRESNSNLTDTYFDLLKGTDKEILKNAGLIEKVMDKISKTEIKL
ncbi:hypothetical protein [Kamptonema sp. UHCC 0994]|uniref:hypothetical protein n=1 Tax=Kamptonema sp. UHCC 0994 TaxID=3031329 RepID=UPI0023BA9A98|nr:hypothetical protein [Kamptonema sp. UHCC 0994]MDF0556517.1 hypothetical protein [Kamptonema sp. UHCC 0994]